MLAGRDLRFWHFSMLGHQLHAAALGAAGDDTRLSDANLVAVSEGRGLID